MCECICASKDFFTWPDRDKFYDLWQPSWAYDAKTKEYAAMHVLKCLFRYLRSVEDFRLKDIAPEMKLFKKKFSPQNYKTYIQYIINLPNSLDKEEEELVQQEIPKFAPPVKKKKYNADEWKDYLINKWGEFIAGQPSLLIDSLPKDLNAFCEGIKEGKPIPELLGLTPGATKQEKLLGIRAKMFAVHPDKMQNNSLATFLMAILVEIREQVNLA